MILPGQRAGDVKHCVVQSCLHGARTLFNSVNTALLGSNKQITQSLILPERSF